MGYNFDHTQSSFGEAIGIKKDIEAEIDFKVSQIFDNYAEDSFSVVFEKCLDWVNERFATSSLNRDVIILLTGMILERIYIKKSVVSKMGQFMKAEGDKKIMQFDNLEDQESFKTEFNALVKKYAIKKKVDDEGDFVSASISFETPEKLEAFKKELKILERKYKITDPESDMSDIGSMNFPFMGPMGEA